MENMFLKNACAWFIAEKAPGLREKIVTTLLMVEKKEPLKDGHKSLLGFILFDYCMHFGPASFTAAEIASERIGVTEQLEYYANDWIEYRKKNKQIKP